MAEIQKVTNLNKIVTDPVVLKRLTEQKIDSRYVEFYQDYAPRSLGKEHSPYAKFYRDLKSRKKIMVVSGLPMVKPDGTKIDVGWTKQGNKYVSKANLFSAIVDRGQVTLTCLSDQPSGTKKDAQVIWNPQLFLDGKEVKGSKAALLDVDPTNPNYHQNTFEWDYGICKRRIRIIEGRFREKWVFDSNPQGEVRIKHNISGNLPLKLGRGRDSSVEDIQVQVDGDTEIVSIEEFSKAVYPVEIGASPETFYPDAHEENTSVDGQVRRKDVGGLTWESIHDDAGTAADPSDASANTALIHADANQDKWDWLDRSIFLFDTSGLPDVCTITGAVLSIYSVNKWNRLGVASTFGIFSSNPNTNTNLITSDYGVLGTTLYSATIAYADIAEGDYNGFTLNDLGKVAISKTSISKFGEREVVYDAGDTEPPWASSDNTGHDGYFAEQGNGFKPKLVVTYTTITEFVRSLSTAMGLSASLARSQGFVRSLSTSAGLNTTLTRAVTYERPLTVAVGLSASLTRIKGLVRSLTTSVGLDASLARTVTYARTLSTDIRLDATLTRAVTYIRSLTTDIRLSVTLSRSQGFVRSLSTAIGIDTTLSRVQGFVRSLSTDIRLSVGLTRKVDYIRALTTDIRMDVSLSRAVAFIRGLTTDIRMSTTLSRAVGYARTLTTNIGMSATLSRSQGHVRTLTTAIGLYVRLFWRGKFKRPTQSIGTNRTLSSIGTNRDVGKVGTDRTLGEVGTPRDVEDTGTNRDVETW